MAQSAADTGWLPVIGRFIERHGLATLIAGFLVWTLVSDRRADAAANTAAQAAMELQLRDVNGNFQRLSSQFAEHSEEGKEVIRILLADCVNSAGDSTARDRCMGR